MALDTPAGRVHDGHMMNERNELETLRASYRALLQTSRDLLKARNAIESCIDPEWTRLHKAASEAYRNAEAVEKQIARIVKADPAWLPSYFKAIDGR